VIDLDIIRIHDSPMKLVIKNKVDVVGCFYYGDNFYRRENFTREMEDLYAKYHAETLVQRLEEV
jgi:hypothetical protein